MVKQHLIWLPDSASGGASGYWLNTGLGQQLPEELARTPCPLRLDYVQPDRLLAFLGLNPLGNKVHPYLAGSCLGQLSQTV